jgi:hypothetical protein
MKKSHKDRLANALVDELLGKASGHDEQLAGEIEAGMEDRDEVHWSLAHEDPADVETGIESARALIDRLDLERYDGEVSWELEQRIHHTRGVLANAFFALYGGFGERPEVEA